MGAKPRLGFIGLGIMGRPMAGHLLRAGYEVGVYTRTKSKAEEVLAAGGVWCGSPAAVARDCEILLTIVTDTPDVDAVLFGEAGAAETLREGAVVVDMTTADPEATRGFAERLGARGVELVDAPVTGGDVGAQKGTLTIMCGGRAEAFERVRAVLEVMGRNVVHVGAVGSGQTLKACNQILCAVNMIGVCEALALAERAGLDGGKLVEVLSGGAGGSWALTNLGKKIVDEELGPAFMIKLIQKDLRIVQAAGQRRGVPLPGTALSQQLFRAVEAEEGGGALGTQAMIKAYRRLMG